MVQIGGVSEGYQPSYSWKAQPEKRVMEGKKEGDLRFVF